MNNIIQCCHCIALIVTNCNYAYVAKPVLLIACKTYIYIAPTIGDEVEWLWSWPSEIDSINSFACICTHA